MSSPSAAGQVIQCQASDGFARWLAQAGGSVAITTYQAGKVALVGFDGQRVSVLLRQFDKPMGLAAADGRLALATRRHVWLFADAPSLAVEYDQPGRYDALYLPRLAYHTGDLLLHDLAFVGDEIWVVNTRFSCLAALSGRYCFEPRWQPSFIRELAPEDRCHLNGLCVVDGRPAYVTALGETNEPGGWRPGKASGGIVIELAGGAIVQRGLSMPHSPRWHDGRLWLLNSGAGELWHCQPGQGLPTVVCALPGYLRGLCLVGQHALIGLSLIREKHTFGGLPVQQRFDRLHCGVALIDLRTGQQAGMLEFTAGCEELYDVQFLPGARRPMIANAEQDVAWQALPAPGFGYWMRPA